MRKINFILLSLILICFSFTSCTNNTSNEQLKEQYKKALSQYNELSDNFQNTTSAYTIEDTTQEPTTTQHNHDFSPANCTTPKTCISCSETIGEPLGHEWVDATCESPKTCLVCNTTDGEPLDHNWKSATCSSPKTCIICEKTEGSANDHIFSDGKCICCNEFDSNYSANSNSNLVWIPTNGGTKYHSHSNCSKMKAPMQVTESEAINQGFTPCKRCY